MDIKHFLDLATLAIGYVVLYRHANQINVTSSEITRAVNFSI